MTLPFRNNTYPTQQGDMLDAICLKVYGRWSLDVLLPVVLANPWVLHGPLQLPAGKVLILPAAPKLTKQVATIQMWQDEPITAETEVASLLTYAPDKQYEGYTLEEYLEEYRRNKHNGGFDQFVSLEQASSPLYGSISNSNNEVYRYSPQAGFVGVDRFQLRATDGTLSDTDVIEIVVPATGSVNRFEIFTGSELNVKSVKLMFCAVKRTRIDSIQAFISRAEQELIGSHEISGGINYAYADVTVQKRLTSGGVVPFGNIKRLFNTHRTDAIAATDTSLNAGECLIAQVTSVKGNVWGLWLDVYSTIDEAVS